MREIPIVDAKKDILGFAKISKQDEEKWLNLANNGQPVESILGGTVYKGEGKEELREISLFLKEAKPMEKGELKIKIEQLEYINCKDCRFFYSGSKICVQKEVKELWGSGENNATDEPKELEGKFSDVFVHPTFGCKYWYHRRLSS